MAKKNGGAAAAATVAVAPGTETEVKNGAETEVKNGAETEVKNGAETEVKNGAETEVKNGAETEVVGTNEDGTEKKKKVKKERLFKSALDLTDIRKEEQKLAGKFNRVGRAVKALGLDAENEKAILDVLAKEFETRAKKVFEKAPGAVAEAPAAVTDAASLV